jgi:hypothetical protein
MGQIELRPAPVARVVRLSKESDKSAVAAKAKGPVPGATEAAVPLTPYRLELIMAYSANAARGDSEAASRIAQRFAPRASEEPDETLPAAAQPVPFLALISGIRTLTLVLIAAALLPNLTLAAFWLGFVDPPWSRPVAAASSQGLALSPPPLPVLSAPDALDATAGQELGLPLALDGTDGVPAGSSVVVRGLPAGSVLSAGHARGWSEWALKPDEIGDLRLVLPETAAGRTRLSIGLVAPDDRVLTEAATILKVAPLPVPPDDAVTVEAEPGEADAEDLAVQEPESAAENTAAPADASAESQPPLPDRRPALPDQSGEWVKPSAYVNLRGGPASTTAVVGVVAKGAKLRVLARKRGWVQVSDPATSRSGWIYSGNVQAAR